MSNMFNKRDVNKRSVADDILNAGKQINLKDKEYLEGVTQELPQGVDMLVNNNGNNNNSIVITKKDEELKNIKRQTYHLSERNIKNISDYADEARMGKSEFLNFLLDTVFQNLKIE